MDAQAMMAEDPALLDAAEGLASDGGTASASGLAAAVATAADAIGEQLAGLDDPLLAARAADVRDVAARIGRVLTGDVLDVPAAGSVAIADDLPPSVTAELPPGSLAGIVMERGTRTAHAAILARALGIPAVVGVAGLGVAADLVLGGPTSDALVSLDGETGDVVLAPDAEAQRDFAARHDELEARRRAAAALRGTAGATADGHRVALVANIGRPDEASRALEAGAEGVGLFRTEFVFMGRDGAPTEDEQLEAYRSVLAAFGPDRPVVIRLADIGGDKAIPYLHLPHEENPFLGVRALRLAYGGDRSLLVTQLRAILRAGADAKVVPHVMAPMVATVDDVRLLRSLVEEAVEGLVRDGRPRAEGLEVGIMIEIPAAAVTADRLAPLVDFMSLGTNDLTQYTMAADRTNADVGALQDALHPAVLRLVRSTADAGANAGIVVAVCGESAADPAAALVLVGLGVTELSMDAGALDAVRDVLSRHPLPALRELAAKALDAESAGDVRELVAAFLRH
jgi:phosphotransferase system enzyme I (PtsI)